MSSSTGNPLCDPAANANPDMQGFAIRLSSFITQGCLGILISTSEVKDPEGHRTRHEGENMFLLQTYSVVLSTYLTLDRSQLSVNDANFSLLLTSLSPLGFYLAIVAILDLHRHWRKLFTVAGFPRRTTSLLSVLLHTLVFVLIILASLPNAFMGSDCPDSTLRDMAPGYTLAPLGQEKYAIAGQVTEVAFLVYFCRHFQDILNESRRRRDGNFRKWVPWLRWAQSPVRYVRSWAASAWIVIVYSHPWLKLCAIIYIYAFWSKLLRPFSVEPDYQMTYGQLLALFTTIEPLFSTLKLLRERWRDIWELLLGLPRSFFDGLKFILTGKKNPWKLHSKEYLPVDALDPVMMTLLPSNSFHLHNQLPPDPGAAPTHPVPCGDISPHLETGRASEDLLGVLALPSA